eukprot:TRINITY_DN34067_c0_g1_i1.p1 TRINITY_DN34067_c0_g1~~TRINITY_DN34067_c0_g1_i1.p1  ORF type:complete len:672 (+),score=205.90 TRINITY_DN34067_c0_g1_i1:80-2017(+)
MSGDDGSSQTADIVDAVKAGVRAQLLDILDEVTGQKVLLLDSTVVGSLDLVVTTADFKDRGVLSWFKLTDQAVQSDCSQMIFVVRSTRPELMDWVAAQILADEREKKDRVYEVVLIPRKTEECAARLLANNVRANVRIVEFGLHFFPFDRDILSMEVPRAFHDVHVLGDPTSLFHTAQGIMKLQAQFGVIPHVHAIGSAANGVLDCLLRLRSEAAGDGFREPESSKELTQKGVPPVAPHSKRKEDAGGGGAPSPKIAELVLLDRRVDIFSLLCSQFTYQALLDMAFGIRNNSADISSADFVKEKDKHMRLSPEDPFFQEIRDLHIDKLGPLLQQRAMAIHETYQEKDRIKNPSEMQEYVKKFKSAHSVHGSLEQHINLARHLKGLIHDDAFRFQLQMEDDITSQASQLPLESLEDLLDDQKPIHEVLRLLCLHSVVNNGMKAKQLDQIKKVIVQAYGYEHLLTLCNLEKVGLLRYQQGKSSWPAVKRHFNLFVEDGAAETDVSYAYSGYAPLTVRLVQMTKSKPNGWRSCQDALSLLWGPAQVLKQVADPGVSEDALDPSQPQVVLVVFIGGVTYGEIAALRRLSEIEGGKRRFLIVTSEIISTKKLFESLKNEQVFNQPSLELRKQKQEAKKSSGGFGFGFGRG